MAKARKKAAHPQIEMVPIDSLVPWDGNPRINEPAVGPLVRSIEAFGWLDPIVARRKDRMVLAGHARLKAARELDLQMVPVIFANLTVSEGKLYSIADNQIASLSGWDSAKRNTAMRELLTLNMDLTLTGFDKGALRVMTREGAGGDAFDAEAALKEAERECRCERGQVWICGDHRVMCGDSTDAEDVARLMAGERATLMVTDPPYGINYEGNWLWGGKPVKGFWKGGIEHDDSETGALMCQVAKLAPLIAGGAIYICAPSGIQLMETWAMFASAEWHLQCALVWNKDSITPGRWDYNPRHEMIVYGWAKGRHSWYGPTNEATVWDLSRPHGPGQEHPTQKPVPLFERMLQNSSQPSACIYDPFLGSGTTVIAAERLGRHCYGMEIEPRYVHVSLARWETETGTKAKLAT